MTSSLRVAIYARQSVEEPQGILQQLEDCRVEAQRRGWTVIDTYPDDDVSGTKTRGEKTQWARMLTDFDAGKFEAVLANDVDRLTRSLTDVLELRPPKRDVRVLTVRGGIDTHEDDTTLKLLVVLAEREVKLKTIRAARYAKERRAKGHRPAGRTAYGYRWVRAADRDEAGTRFRIDEDEAAIVKRIFSEFLAQASLGQIARDLNASGIRTREGSRWHTSTLRRILINPHYAALLPPVQAEGQNDQAKVVIEDCVPGAWEPIIELEHLLAARGLLVGRAPNHQGTARAHLLSGIPTFGVCGGPVRSSRARTHPTKRKDGGRAPQKYNASYRCLDGHFVRRGKLIDAFITEVCIERLSRPDAADLVERPADGPDLAVLSAKRTELESRDAAIALLLARGKMTPKAAEDALDELARELAVVNQQIADAISKDPLAEVAASDDARAWWEAATLARRRAVIETLMDIVIHPVGNGKRLRTFEEIVPTLTISWKRGPKG